MSVTRPTRTRLVEAAWRCIREGGIEAATSRAITTAAAANLGAITYHFGSKEAVVAEAVCGAVEDLITPAIAALEAGVDDPVAALLAAVALLQEGYRHVTTRAPAYLEALALSRRMPLVHERLTALLARVRHLLARQMSEYQADGYLPPWVEPEAMAGLLIAVAEGVIMASVIDDAGPDTGAMADQFAQLLIAGASQPS
jgi:AcrR family transcriptional regulator